MTSFNESQKIIDNQENIIKEVEKAYALQADSVSQLFDGPDNFYWQVETKTGQTYAVRISKRDPATGVPFEAEWIKYLSSRGLVVPSVLSTNRGQACLTLPQGTITIFEFITGRELVTGDENPAPLEAVASAGAVLAKFHNVSQGHQINQPRPRTIFSELERVERKAEEVEKNVSGGDELVRKVQEYLKWGRDQQYQKVLIHNDYHFGNIIFNDSYEVKAVLDFDWACQGPAIKDLGHALALWSLPGTAKNYYNEVFKNFLDKYNQIATEKIDHDQELNRWIQFACLSDVSTWIIDCLEEGDPKPLVSCYNYQRFQFFI